MEHRIKGLVVYRHGLALGRAPTPTVPNPRDQVPDAPSAPGPLHADVPGCRPHLAAMDLRKKTFRGLCLKKTQWHDRRLGSTNRFYEVSCDTTPQLTARIAHGHENQVALAASSSTFATLPATSVRCQCGLGASNRRRTEKFRVGPRAIAAFELSSPQARALCTCDPFSLAALASEKDSFADIEVTWIDLLLLGRIHRSETCRSGFAGSSFPYPKADPARSVHFG